MPFPSSIPPELHGEVVRRWLNGDAAQGIADWVTQSAARRGKKAPTSRTSVTRLVRKLSQRFDDRAPGAVIRARLEVPAALAAIASIDAAYQALSKEAEDAPREALRRIGAELAECARQEKLLHRLLEVAGVGTEAAHALASATPFDSIGLDSQSIDDSKRAECESNSPSDDLTTATEGFESIAVVRPAIHGAASETRPDPSVSIALGLQPIDDSKRATASAPSLPAAMILPAESCLPARARRASSGKRCLATGSGDVMVPRPPARGKTTPAPLTGREMPTRSLAPVRNYDV